MKLLDRENTLLLIIDVQERLVASLDKDIIVTRVEKLLGAANSLDIPVLISEQYPNGLGHTVPQLAAKIKEGTPIVEKCSFSLLREEGMLDKIKSFGKKQIVICGIETHICVHQTAAELIDAGFDVVVAKDACASRSKYEFKQGIEAMQANGAKISCVEIILFEWLRTAKHPKFKEVQALIK